jgi:DNA polymerase I
MTEDLPLLLIDADVPLYKASFASEIETEWDDDLWTLHSDLGTAKEIFEQEIEAIRAEFPDDFPILLCFSGSNNWRNTIYPEYKANRKKNRKPIVLSPLKEWAMKTYDSKVVDTLEADDLLGLLSEEGIMISVDKDLKTVAGLHFNPNYPEDGITEITPEYAHYNHMFQTLCGDSTDGYKGCPSVGPKTAAKILDVPTEDMWVAVLETFASKGIEYDEALVQARLARILRGSDYILSSNTLKLWKPANV